MSRAPDPTLDDYDQPVWLADTSRSLVPIAHRVDGPCSDDDQTIGQLPAHHAAYVATACPRCFPKAPRPGCDITNRPDDALAWQRQGLPPLAEERDGTLDGDLAALADRLEAAEAFDPTHDQLIHEVQQLRDLVRHADLHSAYRFCGYAKMDSAQRALWRHVCGWDGDAFVWNTPPAGPVAGAGDTSSRRPGPPR